MQSIIIGTAGHIDHGKSALVRALTGTDPDRLPEEKKRGITIDLGFADLDLGDVRVGFVDVPGHERFIKNMLAGAHGIDAVALVIAADEGVMPQTREHFDICRLLGLRRGLIVITKTDLVAEELVSLVRAEAEELVAGSFLEAAPILEVSARTGNGLDELRIVLRQLALALPARSVDMVMRLPVDRAFSMKGFGAVVTGTLVSGEISEGDDLELLPRHSRVRARGVQVHGRSVTRARAGERTAVNLGGIDVASIERGMVLAPFGRLQTTQILDVSIDVLPSAPRALRSRARVRVHLGAAEILGRLRVLGLLSEATGLLPPEPTESNAIAPGASGFAQLRLESPVVASPDERFIIRSYAPSLTVAGGRVLDPAAGKHRGKDLELVRERLRKLADADPENRLVVFIETAGDHGLKFADLAARTGWTDELLAKSIAAAKASGSLIEADGVFLASANFNQLCNAAEQAIASHHLREPLARGLARETLRERYFARVAPEVFRAVIARLEQDSKLVAEKDLVRAPQHSLDLSAADKQLRDQLAQVYESAGLEAPAIDEAMERAGVPSSQRTHARKILHLLIDGQVLIRVQGDLFIHQAPLSVLRRKLADYAASHEPERAIDVAAFKELAGVSRKYAIPLLEYLDREHVTQRQGDRRVIQREK
jgi:selenocysteine-specific elongation factor